MLDLETRSLLHKEANHPNNVSELLYWLHLLGCHETQTALENQNPVSIFERGKQGIQNVFTLLGQSGSGRLSAASLVHPDARPHGLPHEKRMFETTQFCLERASKELNFTYEPTLLAMAAAIKFHDIQQARLEANKIEGHNPKAGHATGGTLYFMASMDMVSKAFSLDSKQSHEMRGITVIMQLLHDNPNIAMKSILSATKSADGLRGDALLQAFTHGDLHLGTLSPSQIVEITRMQSKFKTTYGLPSDIEVDNVVILEQLSHDDRPILPALTPEQWESVQYGTLLLHLADVMEMVVPLEHAMMRMLGVPTSIESVFLGKEQTVEELLSEIKNPTQNGHSSDFGRKLLEFELLLRYIRETPLGKSESMRSFVLNHAIEGLLRLEQISLRMIKKDDSLIHEICDMRRGSINLMDADAQSRIAAIDAEEQHISECFKQKMAKSTYEERHGQVISGTITEYLKQIQDEFEVGDFVERMGNKIARGIPQTMPYASYD